MITTNIIADSINDRGVRLTSFLMTYPRFIHSELMTHRVFSRNAASSRAIPLTKMVAAVKENPAMPEYWGRNQKGMQAKTQLEGVEKYEAEQAWLMARNRAVDCAELLASKSVHKQLANRVLEPFSHITTLVTASEYENFFSLRAHTDAQPEFMVLAYRSLDRYLKNTPRFLERGEWHLPFGDKVEGLDEPTKLKVVTARCARLSYLTFDGNFSVEEDVELHNGLVSAGHWSPFEHPARAGIYYKPSNFGPGWHQYRKEFPNENRTGVNLQAVLDARPDWVTLE